MASGSVISLGIQVDGEKTFNDAIKAIDAQIKSFGAGIDTATASMDKMGGGAEASAKKTALLSETIQTLHQKLDILNEQYQRGQARLEELKKSLDAAKASSDPNEIDKATNAYNSQVKTLATLQTNIEKTNAALITANKDYKDATSITLKLKDAWETVQKTWNKLSHNVVIDKVKKVSSATIDATAEITKYVAEAAVQAGQYIFDLTTEAGKYADTMLTLADTSNVDVINLQKWEYASQFVDTEVSTITGTLTKLTKNMADGAAKTETLINGYELKQEEAFEKLDELYKKRNAAIEDGDKKAIASANEAIEKQKEVINKINEQLNNASSDMDKAFAKLGVSTKTASGQLKDAETVFWEVIDALGNIDNETERDALAMTLLGRSAKDLNPLIKAGSDAFKALGDEAESAGLILSEDAMSALGEVDDAMNRVNSTISGLKKTVAVMFAPAISELTDGFSAVVQAGIEMVNGTEGSEEKFLAAIDNLTDTAIRLLDDMLPVILETGVKIIVNLVSGISNNIEKVASAITNVIKALLETVVENLPEIINTGVGIIIALIDGIISAIPTLVDNLPQIIVAIADGIIKLIPKLFEVGGKLVLGLLDGIVNAIPMLLGKIKEALGSAFNWLLDLLGIHSPSTVMRDQVGKMLVLGIADGITESADVIQEALDSAAPDPAKVVASLDTVTDAFDVTTDVLTEGFSAVVKAGKEMVNGTEGSKEQFLDAIHSLADKAVIFLNDMLPEIIETGLEVVASLLEGISKNMGRLQEFQKVINKILNIISENMPQLIHAGVNILLALINGIIDAIPSLAAKMPEIIEAIVSGLAKLAPRLWEAGKNIIVGLWEGIKERIVWLWEQIKEALGSVFGWLLDLLGIESPSKVMRDKVGKMLVLGVAEGITGSADKIQQALDDAMPSPEEIVASVDNVSVAARVTGRAASGSGPLPWQDNRPIILRLNDRELGRAVRGYARGYA